MRFFSYFLNCHFSMLNWLNKLSRQSMLEVKFKMGKKHCKKFVTFCTYILDTFCVCSSCCIGQRISRKFYNVWCYSYGKVYRVYISIRFVFYGDSSAFIALYFYFHFWTNSSVILFIVRRTKSSSKKSSEKSTIKKVEFTSFFYVVIFANGISPTAFKIYVYHYAF